MMLKAPFPYFGGKSVVASQVWRRFGNTPNFIDPFCGSAAMLLGRPANHFKDGAKTETINDLNGFIVNAYRAIQADPEQVATYANRPVFESDMHAIHVQLINQRSDLSVKLEGDPDYYDPKIAGWWIWGQCVWLGTGWCAGDGAWISVDGRLVNRHTIGTPPADSGVDRKLPSLGDDGRGVNRKLPSLGNDGRGVNRQLPSLGNDGRGVKRQLPSLSSPGMGVRRKLPNVSKGGHGVQKVSVVGQLEALIDWFVDLQDRLSRVRVVCGDWMRVLKPAVTTSHGLTAIFLDPPYPQVERTKKVYQEESADIAYTVREWAIHNGDDPRFRIAYCGYDDGFKFPKNWQVYRWKANGGFSNAKKKRGYENKFRETIWFSPYCLDPYRGSKQLSFLDVE